MVGTIGFEPTTSSVSRKRSNQLSYAPAECDLISLSASAWARKKAVADSRRCFTIDFWRVGCLQLQGTYKLMMLGLDSTARGDAVIQPRTGNDRSFHAPEPAQHRTQPPNSPANLPGAVPG